MKINFKKCTEEELWKYIATHLSKNNIDSVLVGGSVVAIYSKGMYRSGDLDIVLLTHFKEKLDPLMLEIGFERHGRHFIHPECDHLIVEFPPGPVSIGDDSSIVPREVKFEGTIIKLFSPTDCIKDRLASFIHFRARDCLDQAVLVAKSQPYNHDAIKKWCENEGGSAQFKLFEEELLKRNI